MIKIINILLFITIFTIIVGCKTNQPTQESNSGVQNIPNIVKALEALGTVGKKEVDKNKKK